jgi:hypothetical protein
VIDLFNTSLSIKINYSLSMVKILQEIAFFLCQGGQRAPEIMINTLLNVDKKYSKKKINKTKRKKWRKMKKAAKKSNECLDRKVRTQKKRNDSGISGAVRTHDVTK